MTPPTPLTCREFCTRNDYAGQLQHYIPSQCKHTSKFMKNDDIKAEYNKRLVLFVANKISLLPCAIIEPKYFFITGSVALLAGTIGTTVWRMRYPPIAERKSGWREYFESSAVLDETASRLFITALVIHAIVNNVSSLLWPDQMVWYNAIYVGLSVGIITSKMVLTPQNFRKLSLTINSSEPLLPAETV